MEDFAGEHGISYEGIPSPKGEDTAEEWDVSVRTTDLEEQEPRYEDRLSMSKKVFWRDRVAVA